MERQARLAAEESLQLANGQIAVLTETVGVHCYRCIVSGYSVPAGVLSVATVFLSHLALLPDLHASLSCRTMAFKHPYAM
jgi:hypothetical protein